VKVGLKKIAVRYIAAKYEIVYKLAHRADKANFSSVCVMRASAVEPDRAHNPEVAGSNPAPATKTKLRGAMMLPFNFGVIGIEMAV
jgi:hypothetical protein